MRQQAQKQVSSPNTPLALIWSQTNVVSKTQLRQDLSDSLTMKGNGTNPDERRLHSGLGFTGEQWSVLSEHLVFWDQGWLL
jgi:hypothetical protein